VTENVLPEAPSLYKRSGGLRGRNTHAVDGRYPAITLIGVTGLFDPGSLVAFAVIPEER
jgi:hypothetical protein